MAPEKKSTGRPLGPTGESVRTNIRRIRDRDGVSAPELAERLTRLDRPIPPLGIHRIETGQRRVDVDDLVALALALDVSPFTLLMPCTESGDASVRVTGVEGGLQARRLWWWLRIQKPLLDTKPEAEFPFLQRALPTWQFLALARQAAKVARMGMQLGELTEESDRGDDQ